MIFWKEWRETMPLMLAATIAICGISYLKWEGWRIEFFEFQFWLLAAMTLIFFAPFLGAAAIAGERENGTLDVLLARPTRPAAIFFIKYFVRLGGVILALLTLVALFFLLRPTHNLELHDVARAVAILASLITFMLTASFLASCLADTSSRAYIASLALVYMTLFVLNATRFIKYTWWWSDSFDDMWLEYTAFYSILSLIFLAIGAILFMARPTYTYNSKHMILVGILIFLTLIRSASAGGWLVAGVLATGDLDLVTLIRKPLPELLASRRSARDRNTSTTIDLYLVTSRNPRLERNLIKELKNPKAHIRSEVLKILTDRKAKDAAGDVIPLLNDSNNEVSHSALMFVRFLKCEEAVPKIIEMLDDPNSSIRQRAIFALGAIKEKDAGPYLMKALKDPNPLVHSAAVRELCRWDYTEAQEEIVKLMLESPIKYSRQLAALYLGLLKSAPACDALISVLSSEDERLVNNAVSSLGKLGCEDSLDALLEMAERIEERDPTSREGSLAMIMALKGIGGPGAVGKLKEMFAEPLGSVDRKIEIALALAELRDDTGIPYLRKHMNRVVKEISPNQRNQAYSVATRLARAGDYSAVPALIKLTDGKYPPNNYRYGKTLEKLTGKKYGWDTKRWTKWWEKNKDELLQTTLAGNVDDGGD